MAGRLLLPSSKFIKYFLRNIIILIKTSKYIFSFYPKHLISRLTSLPLGTQSKINIETTWIQRPDVESTLIQC